MTKALTVQRYATRIQDRTVKFKKHTTLGQVKAATGWFVDYDDAVHSDYKYRPIDGHFTCDMTVYQLNLRNGEYEPWIEIKKGDRRSQHPDLMPAENNPPPFPDDPPEHRRKMCTHHTLECAWPGCEITVDWYDSNTYITEKQADLLRRIAEWRVKNNHWICGRHEEEQ